MGKLSGLQFSQYKKTEDFHRETQKTRKILKMTTKGSRNDYTATRNYHKKTGRAQRNTN